MPKSVQEGHRLPGKRQRIAIHILRLSGPTLAPFTDHQPHRIHFCYRPITNSANKRLRFTNRDPDDGLQTWSGSPEALAPAAGIRTDSKGNYRCPFRRWRRTNPTGRLIDHLNKGCAPLRYTTFDNISTWHWQDFSNTLLQATNRLSEAEPLMRRLNP